MKTILHLFVFAGLAAAAHAQLVYSSGHADIGIGFEDDTLEPHWHFHGGAVVGGAPLPGDAEYEPDEIVAEVAESQQIARPPGAAWDFLGVPAGETIWYLPQVQESGVPFLGFGAEELNPADWLQPFTITLTGKTGAGDFSLWANGAFGSPIVYMQTANGISSADFVPILAGDHAHYNWGFTAAGFYELTLRFDGVHADLGAVSQTATFAFNIVPEPAAVTMLLAAGGLLLGSRRRARA